MISLLIGIFLVILFIVTVVLSASTWRGWHIAAACLVFLSAIGLVIVGSLSLKTHTTWRKQHADVEKKLNDAVREGIILETGDPAMVVAEPPSLNDIQHHLNRILLDRGRVWRRCTPSAPTGSSILISTVPPLEDGSPGDPNTAKPNGADTNMVLYAFREDANGVPVAYLGEFKVIDAQTTSVTLEPTMALDGQQNALVGDTTAYWTMYEMMPLDEHRVFSDIDTVGKSLDDTEEPIFGAMNETDLRTIFSLVTGLAVDSPEVTELVGPYVKDGTPASEQDRNLSPESIWLKLEFEKVHQESVDSNALDTGIAGDYFDPEGKAVVTRLRSGDENGRASFRVNDIGVFPYAHDTDKQEVDNLISSGACSSLGPFYVRNLRDYEEAFHSIQDRFIRRNEDIARVQRDIDALNTTILKTQQQTAYRQDERAKLQADLEGFTRDREKVTELAASLQAQQTALREELSDLYNTNEMLSERLAEYSAKLTDEINRRAADVAVQLQ